MKRFVFYLFGLFCFASQQVYALEWSNIKPEKIGPHTYVIEHGSHDEDPKISHSFHNNPGFVAIGRINALFAEKQPVFPSQSW